MKSAPLPWKTHDAEIWRAASASSRPVAWTLTLAWLGVLATVVPSALGGIACSEAAPCGTTTGLGLLVAAVIAGVVGLHVAPALALAALTAVPVAALIGPPSEAALPVAQHTFLLLVTALSLGYGLLVLRGRRAQDRLAREAAGDLRIDLSDVLEFPDDRPRAWILGRLFAALAAALGAALMLILGRRQVRLDALHERAAEHLIGVTRGHSEYGLVVWLPPTGNEVTVEDTWTGHDPGAEVAVLVDGDWARLAAARYDATGFVIAGLLLVVLAVGLLVRAMRLHRSVAALNRAHLGLLALAAYDDETGRTLVWGADARLDDRPLLALTAFPQRVRDGALTGAAPASRDGLGRIDSAAPFDPVPGDPTVQDPDAPPAAVDPRTVAVLHGRPQEGSVIAVELRPRTSSARLLIPTSFVRKPPDWDDPSVGHLRARQAARRSRAPRLFVAARWERVSVAVLWGAGLALTWWALSAGGSTTPWAPLGVWLIGLIVTVMGTAAFTFQLLVDSEGLRSRGATGWFGLEWEALSRIDSDGTALVLHTTAGIPVELGGRFGDTVLQWFGMPDQTRLLALELDAMLRDPTVRPSGPDTSRRRGSVLWYVGSCLTWTLVVLGAVAS